MKPRKAATLLFATLLLAVVVWSVLDARKAHAQEVRGNIPKSYGSLKGAALDLLIFEDSQGTIRLVSIQEGDRSAGQVRQIWVRP